MNFKYGFPEERKGVKLPGMCEEKKQEMLRRRLGKTQGEPVLVVCNLQDSGAVRSEMEVVDAESVEGSAGVDELFTVMKQQGHWGG